MAKKVLSWILGIIFLAFISWIVVFGFIKTEYQDQISLSSKHSTANVYKYLTNPNFFPEWVQGYRRSQRVTSSSETEKSIYLLSIEDEEELKLIYSSRYNDSATAFSQEFDHPFYTLQASLNSREKEDRENKINIELKISGNGIVERILAPFYVFQVLEDYEKQYESALKAVK